jgi:hypothetical protein
MAVVWLPDESQEVDAALAAHPADSGRCAALARRIAAVGVRRDPATIGVQIKPCGSARFIVSSKEPRRHWHQHVVVETHAHRVDALTGSTGWTPTSTYLREHFSYPEFIRETRGVDLSAIDLGIQREEQ